MEQLGTLRQGNELLSLCRAATVGLDGLGWLLLSALDPPGRRRRFAHQLLKSLDHLPVLSR